MNSPAPEGRGRGRGRGRKELTTSERVANWVNQREAKRLNREKWANRTSDSQGIETAVERSPDPDTEKTDADLSRDNKARETPRCKPKKSEVPLYVPPSLRHKKGKSTSSPEGPEGSGDASESQATPGRERLSASPPTECPTPTAPRGVAKQAESSSLPAKGRGRGRARRKPEVEIYVPRALRAARAADSKDGPQSQTSTPSVSEEKSMSANSDLHGASSFIPGRREDLKRSPELTEQSLIKTTICEDNNPSRKSTTLPQQVVASVSEEDSTVSQNIQPMVTETANVEPASPPYNEAPTALSLPPSEPEPMESHDIDPVMMCTKLLDEDDEESSRDFANSVANTTPSGRHSAPMPEVARVPLDRSLSQQPTGSLTFEFYDPAIIAFMPSKKAAENALPQQTSARLTSQQNCSISQDKSALPKASNNFAQTKSVPPASSGAHSQSAESSIKEYQSKPVKCRKLYSWTYPVNVVPSDESDKKGDSHVTKTAPDKAATVKQTNRSSPTPNPVPTPATPGTGNIPPPSIQGHIVGSANNFHPPSIASPSVNTPFSCSGNSPPNIQPSHASAENPSFVNPPENREQSPFSTADSPCTVDQTDLGYRIAEDIDRIVDDMDTSIVPPSTPSIQGSNGKVSSKSNRVPSSSPSPQNLPTTNLELSKTSDISSATTAHDTNCDTSEDNSPPEKSKDSVEKPQSPKMAAGVDSAKSSVAPEAKASSPQETKKSSVPPQDDEEEEEGDSWDALYDDNGDCLDESTIQELTDFVGKVDIDKPKINYLKYEPKEPELNYEAFSHIIEIYDFSPDLATHDLISVFRDFSSRGFDVKWVDDTHALGVFSSAMAAKEALRMIHPLLKVRPMSEASRSGQSKARQCQEFLQPYKARPETSSVAARRLVAGALGMAPKVSREVRDQERKKLKEAKEKRRLERKQKVDIWDGSFGSCALDKEDASER